MPIQFEDRSGEICASQNLFLIEIAFGQRRRTFAGLILQLRLDMGFAPSRGYLILRRLTRFKSAGRGQERK